MSDISTILEAKRVVIMAFGEHKAAIVHKAVEGPVTDGIAASFLQNHDDTTFILDESAAGADTADRGLVVSRSGGAGVGAAARVSVSVSAEDCAAESSG